MNYSNNCFEIYYTSCDKEYIDEVINALTSSLDEYLAFFNLSSLKSKIKIKFYDELADFKDYYENTRNHPYKKGIVGSARDNEIHMLSLKERLKERPNDTFAIFLMGLKHELVHICHIAYKGNSKGTWFAEGLATNLGSPRYECTLEGCTLEELLNKPKYKYCYTLTKYMLDNYSHDVILRYASNDDLILEDTEKILKEAKEYYLSKYK